MIPYSRANDVRCFAVPQVLPYYVRVLCTVCIPIGVVVVVVIVGLRVKVRLKLELCSQPAT